MKIFLTTVSIFFAFTLYAQLRLQGNVSDENSKTLKGAAIIITSNTNTKLHTLSTNDGSYQLNNIAAGKIKLLVTYIGKQQSERQFFLTGDTTINIFLHDEAAVLEPLEVRAVRASDKAPFTKTNLNKEQIEKNNMGQDIPFILNQTPSVVVNSDAGNGVGYTGIRIRGTDATRINVTLNGIPYNDAESQGTYFVDLPDFASSVSSIQVQRGIGTSTNGAGAFGATINLSTNEVSKTAYAESNNTYGSFNTFKNTIKLGSGLLNNHFTVDTRLSRISSDGYIDRAKSNLESFYISAAYINNKTSLRFNVLSGKEKTYQAWYGVPELLLLTNPRFNPAGTEKEGAPYDNQTDNYWQTHYQLFFNQPLSSNLSLSISSFLTRGKGYYEEYKAGEPFSAYGLPDFVLNNDTIINTDLVRERWLDNYFYGQVFSLQYNKNRSQLTIGGSWTNYDGKHFGKVIWANIGIPKDYEYYRFPASKSDENIYAKWLYQFTTKLNLFTDIQYRHVVHDMKGFEDHPDLFIKRTFNFFNPKIGLSYLNNGWQTYISYAMANKEPNRDDFEAGITEQPSKETLHDFEASASKTGKQFSAGITAYYMLYKNQLVLTRKINDVGSYTRSNVPNSYRTGLELQGSYIFARWLNANASLSLSHNKIKNFAEYIDDYDNGGQIKTVHGKPDISFSPDIIGSTSLNLIPIKNLELTLLNKYVSHQYMDNTQNKQRSLKAYDINDIRAAYCVQNILLKQITIAAQVNNVLNKKYQPNGYTYSYYSEGILTTENYYYPMAGISYLISLNVKF